MPLELPCRGGVPTWAMWPDDAKKSGYGREEERTPDVVFLSSRMYNMLYMACISSTAMRCPEARYFGHQFKAGGEVPDRPFCFTCVRRVCQGHCAFAAAIAFSVLSFHARMGQLRSYPFSLASRKRASSRSITCSSSPIRSIAASYSPGSVIPLSPDRSAEDVVRAGETRHNPR